MKTIKWGMIGCGSVTEVKSGPGFYKSEGSELIAVTSNNIEMTKSYAERHNVAKYYETTEELLADDEIDAVYIATPPAFHNEYALKAIEAGKSVYVEKPVALDYESSKAIVDKAKEKDVKVFVAFYRRGMERFRKIKQLIDENNIGQVRCVNVKLHQKVEESMLNRETLPWRVIPAVSGGGIFIDMGVHTLDILDYILGEIEESKGIVSNQGNYYDVEDIVSAVWKHKNGIHGSGSWCFTGFDECDLVEIIGSKGKITFECFTDKPIELYTNKGLETFNYPNPQHVQQPMIQSIVNELLDKGQSYSDVEGALRTSKITNDIVKEYRIKKGY